MPTLTRWLVKAALAWLVAALVLGVAMQHPAAAQVPLLRAAWPTYLLLVGLGHSADGGEMWALAGRSAQGLAAVAFVAQAWPRVKPFR